MKLFDWLFDPFDFGPAINPASGLPMLDDSGIDAGGNPIGTNLSNHFHSDPFSSNTHSDPFPSTSMFDSTGCGSSFDSFGSHSWD